MKLSFKKSICMICIFFILTLMCNPSIAQAYSTYHNTALISSVSNSSNGKFKVALSVPAKTTVTIEAYPNALAGNKQYGPKMEKKTVSVTNDTTKQKTLSKTFAVGFYGQYIIRASHGWKGSIWDEHKCTSKLLDTHYTSKLKWTEKRMKDYRKGKVISTAISEVGSFVMGAALAGPIAGTAFSVTTLGVSIVSSYTEPIASKETIDTVPFPDYSWRYKISGDSNSIKVYLQCYNDANKLVKTTLIETIKYQTGNHRLKVLK